jgi:flagellar basal body-associated protein FliL
MENKGKKGWLITFIIMSVLFLGAAIFFFIYWMKEKKKLQTASDSSTGGVITPGTLHRAVDNASTPVNNSQTVVPSGRVAG